MPTAEYTRPPLYKKQAAFVDDPNDVVCVEAATKTGKTTGCMVWLLERAMEGKAGDNYWWLAPSRGQAFIPFTRYQLGLPSSLYTASEGKGTIQLANGATIWFKSGENPDLLYGDDVKAAVLDEATRMRHEAWIATETVLTATSGKARVIGNVRGRRNWAFKLARNAEAATLPGYSYHKLVIWDAVEAGLVKREYVERIEQDMPRSAFRALYLAEPEDDGGNPFGLQHISNIVREMSDDEPVVWGWDLAKKNDWVVGIGLDKLGTVCRFERWQADWLVTARRIVEFSRSLPSLVDSTGVGDPVLELLNRDGGANFEGFNFGGSADPREDADPDVPHAKQQLMEGLAMAIQQGTVHIPDGLIRQELDAYEYKYTRTRVKYGAPAGMHDDCVCALALAVRHLESGRLRSRGPVVIHANQENSDWSQPGWTLGLKQTD